MAKTGSPHRLSMVSRWYCYDGRITDELRTNYGRMTGQWLCNGFVVWVLCTTGQPGSRVNGYTASPKNLKLSWLDKITGKSGLPRAAGRLRAGHGSVGDGSFLQGQFPKVRHQTQKLREAGRILGPDTELKAARDIWGGGRSRGWAADGAGRRPRSAGGTSMKRDG